MSNAAGTAASKAAGGNQNNRPAAAPAAAPAKPLAVVEAETKVGQLGPSRLRVAEYVRNLHVADAAEGTKVEDLERPEFWAHVAAKLQPRDRIEVWTDDNAWMAEAVVLAATRTDAVVKVLGAWDLNGHQVITDRAELGTKGYEVRFRGHFEKWGVIRKADTEVVHTGSATEGAAWSWVRERLKAGV